MLLDGQEDTPRAPRGNPTLNYQIATPGYFSTMRIQLKAGRLFTRADTDAGPKVALISVSAAKVLWPGQDPIGRRLALPTVRPQAEPSEWPTVVGVVADVHYRELGSARIDVCDPAWQSPLLAQDVVVRVSTDPVAMAGSIRDRIRNTDPNAAVDQVIP